MNDNETWYTSTGAIILALIFFWPVGLFLIYLRLKSTGKYKVFTSIMNGSGIFLLMLGILVIAACAGDPDYTSSVVVALILFVTPGAILMFKAYKRKQRLKIYNRYLNYITINGKTDLNLLAERLCVTKTDATNTVLEMLNNNIISGFINTSDFLILDGYVEPAVTFNNTTYSKNYVAPKSIVIKCKECGAKNTLTVGTTKECEYCGTILQG